MDGPNTKISVGSPGRLYQEDILKSVDSLFARSSLETGSSNRKPIETAKRKIPPKPLVVEKPSEVLPQSKKSSFHVDVVKKDTGEKTTIEGSIDTSTTAAADSQEKGGGKLKEWWDGFLKATRLKPATKTQHMLKNTEIEDKVATRDTEKKDPDSHMSKSQKRKNRKVPLSLGVKMVIAGTVICAVLVTIAIVVSCFTISASRGTISKYVASGRLYKHTHERRSKRGDQRSGSQEDSSSFMDDTGYQHDELEVYYVNYGTEYSFDNPTNAHKACQTLGGALATEVQVEEALWKGASWCGYGWYFRMVKGGEGSSDLDNESTAIRSLIRSDTDLSTDKGKSKILSYVAHQGYPMQEEDSHVCESKHGFVMIDKTERLLPRAGAMCFGVKPDLDSSFGIHPFNFKRYYAEKRAVFSWKG